MEKNSALVNLSNEYEGLLRQLDLKKKLIIIALEAITS